MFGLGNTTPRSPKRAHPVTIGSCLGRSPVFEKPSPFSAAFAEDGIAGLMQNLPIVPPVYGELLQDLFDLLD